MRRSIRATKKPDFLTFPERQLSRTNFTDSSAENLSEPEKSSTNFTLGLNKKPNSIIKNAVPLKSSELTFYEKVVKDQYRNDLIESWLHDVKNDHIRSFNQLLNLLLQAAGAARPLIEKDIDLEALDQEEINLLLKGSIENPEIFFTKCPLLDKSKGKILRDRYKNFWESLSMAILLDSSDTKKLSRDLLRRMVELLIVFSSVAVVNIRIAACDAIFGISSGILSFCKDFKNQFNTAERQLNKALEDTSKSKSLKKGRSEAQKQLDESITILQSIFNAVYMHRSRDISDEVRHICARNVVKFALFDLDQPVRAEYLKYLGWSCNDLSPAVRIAAIQNIRALVENEVLFDHIEGFIQHFMDRFIQIASCDVDSSVSLEMVMTLRVMQQQGFLDSVSEEKLDYVDEIVFDTNTNLEVRREALLFLMDHTEGFDDSNPLPEHESKKSKKGSTPDAKDPRRRDIALQLETLTEFAEHHLRAENTLWSSLLAESCLQTHKADILYEWGIIISLLLRESEDLISTALSPSKVSILLSLFVTVAKDLYQQINENESKRKAGLQALYTKYENLNLHLSTKLSVLLTRFKDDEEHLCLLSELLLVTSPFSSAKSMKNLLNLLQDLFSTCISAPLLRNIALALQTWTKSSLELALKDMTLLAQKEIFTSTIQAYSLARNMAIRSIQKNENVQRRNSKENLNILAEDLFRMQNSIQRVTVLCELYDLTSLGFSLEEIFSEIHDSCEGLLRQAALKICKTEKLSSTLFNILRSSLHALFALVLWSWRGIVAQKDGSINDNELSLVINLRTKLLSTCLSMLRIKSEDDSVESSIFSLVSTEAFRCVSKIRTFFPQRSSRYTVIDKLAYNPTQDILAALRDVFESESRRLLTLISNGSVVRTDSHFIENEVDVVASAEIASELLHTLLLPLSRSLLFDIENLNRRQAAAVLQHVLSPVPSVQDAVRLFCKRLKEVSPIKFMETCLVALKGLFQERLLQPLLQLEAAESEMNENFDFQSYETQRVESFEILQLLSKRLSSIVGTSRVKGALANALDGFLRATVDYALAAKANVGFTCIIISFLRLLPSEESARFSSYFADTLRRSDDLLTEINSSDASYDFKYLTQLQTFLGDKSAGEVSSIQSKRIKTRGVSEKKPVPKKQRLRTFHEIEEEVEDIEETYSNISYSPSYRTHDTSVSVSAPKNAKLLLDVSTGLDLEDIDDEDEVSLLYERRKKDNLSRSLSNNRGEKRSSSSQLLGKRASRKSDSTQGSSLSPFGVESSPIASQPYDDLDKIPSRRRFLI